MGVVRYPKVQCHVWRVKREQSTPGGDVEIGTSQGALDWLLTDISA